MPPPSPTPSDSTTEPASNQQHHHQNYHHHCSIDQVSDQPGSKRKRSSLSSTGDSISDTGIHSILKESKTNASTRQENINANNEKIILNTIRTLMSLNHSNINSGHNEASPSITSLLSTMILEPSNFKKTLEARKEKLQQELDHITNLLSQTSEILKTVESVMAIMNLQKRRNEPCTSVSNEASSSGNLLSSLMMLGLAVNKSSNESLSTTNNTNQTKTIPSLFEAIPSLYSSSNTPLSSKNEPSSATTTTRVSSNSPTPSPQPSSSSSFLSRYQLREASPAHT
jgi:hypothetical protein